MEAPDLCAGMRPASTPANRRNGSFATPADLPEYLDVIIRQRDKHTGVIDQWAIRLDYRIVDTGPGFMVIDAEDDGVSEIVPLKREDVIGQPFAQGDFAVCDAILVQDARVEEILAGWTWSESPPPAEPPPRRN